MTHAYKVRVLGGQRAGASARIQPGQPARIGTGYGNDIVLRDRGQDPVQLELVVEEQPGTAQPLARVTVIEGSAELLGTRVTAGSSMLLPAGVPVGLGQSLLAFGRDGDTAWRDCEALAQRLRGGAEAVSGAAERPRSTRRGGWALLGGACAIAVAIGLLWAALGTARQAEPSPSPDAQRLQQQLAALGFPGLQVIGGGEVPVVRGWLATEAERARLANALAGQRALLQTRSGEELAAAVEAVYRLHGAPVRAEHVGDGVVSVRTEEVDLVKLKRAEERALHDVPGLARVDYAALPDPPLSPPPVRSDPAKRVVSVVGGDDGFLVTADGSRYFVGALLPSGHRIARIVDRHVYIEKDGITTRLIF